MGTPTYAAQLMLNPVLLALAGVAAWRGTESLVAFVLVCIAKAAMDGASARALRGEGFPLRHLALIPAKDLLFGAALLRGFLTDVIEWRGNRLRVLPGTVLVPAGQQAEAEVVARA
jgi:ceramide glucosyltransferase